MFSKLVKEVNKKPNDRMMKLRSAVWMNEKRVRLGHAIENIMWNVSLRNFARAWRNFYRKGAARLYSKHTYLHRVANMPSPPMGISGTLQKFSGVWAPVSWLCPVLGHLLFHSISNQKILLDAGSQLGNGNYLCCHEGSFLPLAGSPGWNQHKGKIRK